MKVAVAIIIDDQNRILITQRPLHVPHGGFWEFPGGKLEIGERAEDALIRETREEIGIEILDYHSLGVVKHQYSDKCVELIVFLVKASIGEPSCKEGQLGMKWIAKANLNPEDFPEANHAVFDLIPDVLTEKIY